MKLANKGIRDACPKKSNVFQLLANATKYYLLVSVAFWIGLWVSQLDSVKKTLDAVESGELQAEFTKDGDGPLDRHVTVWSDAPHGLDNGAVLIGARYSTHLGLFLSDEKGHTLYRWYMENKLYNQDTQQFWKVIRGNNSYVIDDAHLLGSGDVIFTQSLTNLENFAGQRLARMDKDSHILWQVPGDFHHMIDIAGDPQVIYAIASHVKDSLPVIGPKLEGINYLEDWIEVYSLAGQKINGWSMAQALADSPYRSWLLSFEIDAHGFQRAKTPDGRILYDLLHLNSVQYLDSAQAKAVPHAQAGDLLVSFRALNALAVFRPATAKIVYAFTGPWRHQHNAQADEAGHLYLFDNDGTHVIKASENKSVFEEQQSRLIGYNPFTNTVDELFASPDLYSYFLGNYQHLSNGSWIIASPEATRVMVVSGGKILWEWRTFSDRGRKAIPASKQFNMMRYYTASQLGFLSSVKEKTP